MGLPGNSRLTGNNAGNLRLVVQIELMASTAFYVGLFCYSRLSGQVPIRDLSGKRAAHDLYQMINRHGRPQPPPLLMSIQ